MKQFVLNHLVSLVIGGSGSLVLSAAARALPQPEPMGSKLYFWFFHFAQNLLANFDKSANAKQ